MLYFIQHKIFLESVRGSTTKPFFSTCNELMFRFTIDYLLALLSGFSSNEITYPIINRVPGIVDS